MRSTRLLVLSLAVLSILHGAQGKNPADPSERSVRLQALHDQKLPGFPITYYSPGGKERAEKLQAYVDGQTKFYEGQLNVSIKDVIVAVLNPEQWPKVNNSAPYAMPNSGGYPPVILMPSDWSAIKYWNFPKESDVDPALVRSATAGGDAWSDVLYRAMDTIATHELGHLIDYGYGIDSDVGWFKEFLATYTGLVYLMAKHPNDVTAFEILSSLSLRAPHPHTSLSDLDKYPNLAAELPANYGWYQCALNLRAVVVCQKSGINFLKKVKATFPAGGSKRSSDQLIDELDALDPGWKAWANSVAAGQIPTRLLSR